MYALLYAGGSDKGLNFYSSSQFFLLIMLRIDLFFLVCTPFLQAYLIIMVM